MLQIYLKTLNLDAQKVAVQQAMASVSQGLSHIRKRFESDLEATRKLLYAENLLMVFAIFGCKICKSLSLTQTP